MTDAIVLLDVESESEPSRVCPPIVQRSPPANAGLDSNESRAEPAIKTAEPVLDLLDPSESEGDDSSSESFDSASRLCSTAPGSRKYRPRDTQRPDPQRSGPVVCIDLESSASPAPSPVRNSTCVQGLARSKSLSAPSCASSDAPQDMNRGSDIHAASHVTLKDLQEPSRPVIPGHSSLTDLHEHVGLKSDTSNRTFAHASVPGNLHQSSIVSAPGDDGEVLSAPLASRDTLSSTRQRTRAGTKGEKAVSSKRHRVDAEARPLEPGLEKEGRFAARAQKRREADAERERVQRAGVTRQIVQFEASDAELQRGNVFVVVPRAMADGSGTDKRVVARLRDMFPGQVEVCDDDSVLSNVITWRRRLPHVDGAAHGYCAGGDLAFALVVLDAETVCKHVADNTVQGLAEHVLRGLAGKRIEFLVEGVERYCKRVARNRSLAVERGEDGREGTIVAESAVRDCCVLLQVEYGISCRLVRSVDELVRCVCALTDRIAAAPLYKYLSFLDAHRAYRSVQAGTRTTGVVNGEDMGGSAVRVEGCGELGVIYLNFLLQIPGVSLDKAKAVRVAYPTMKMLMSAYARCGTDAERGNMLAHIKVGTRQIGPATSRLISEVFTSREADCQIQIGQRSDSTK